MNSSEEKERAYYLARVQFWQKMFWPFLISWVIFVVIVLGACLIEINEIIELTRRGC